MSENRKEQKLSAYQKGYLAGVRAWYVIMKDDVFRECFSEEEAEDYRKGYMAAMLLIREGLMDKRKE